MMDEFARQMLDAEWGGFPLDILDTADNMSRIVARHEYPYSDGAVLRDLGAAPRETTCTLVFIPPQVIDRMTEFMALVNTGATYRFTHPLLGSYQAKAENVQLLGRGGDRDYLTVSVTFVEDASAGAAFADIAELEDTGGVAAEAAVLSAELTAVGGDTTVATEAVALAESWAESSALSGRQINLEVAEMANAIQAASDAYDLAMDIDGYPLMRSFARLQNNLRNLAQRYISSAPKLSTVTVRAAQPLVAVCQDLYVASESVAACERLLELNDIPNPGLIPSGTVLTIEVPE